MLVPRDMSERSFSLCLVFRHSDKFLRRSWRTHIFSSFASLACAIGDTAGASDLLNLWKLFVCRFSATCSCHVEMEIMSFWCVRRETYEQPTPQRSITAHQHNQRPTKRNQQQPQQQTPTPPPTPPCARQTQELKQTRNTNSPLTFSKKW